MRSFVCKHFHPNWFRVIFQFCERHMQNVFMDEQHDPATMDISVFSIYTIWASFREEFWSCNRTVDFGFLDSYNMWLIKVKESQQFQFLPLMLLIFMLMDVNPLLLKVLLFVPQGEDLSVFSFVRGTNLFSVSKFTCSPKKESKKLKNSHFGQIHVQFVLLTVSCWVSVMNGHSLWIHISQLSHWTALWPFKTAPLQRPQSVLQFVQYQASSPDSILKSSSSPRFEHEAWKRFLHSSHSVSLSDALQYFLHKPHWNLGPGFISISAARMIRINKFVPFDGLNYVISQTELLRLPSFLILAKHWDTLLWECL